MKKEGGEAVKERITMTQKEAKAILDSVIEAETPEKASADLSSMMPTRKHLSKWLGQIGRNQDVRLGKGLDFRRYLGAVVNKLRFHTHSDVNDVTNEENKDMQTKRVKPTVLVKRSKAGSKTSASEDRPSNRAASTKGENPTGESQREKSEPKTASSAKYSKNQDDGDSPEAQRVPRLSRVQEYALKNLLVYADCAVQKDEWGVFDVLARNFDNNGSISYWLNKVGFDHLTKHGKGKDIVDFIRKVSFGVFKDMQKNVGKPIARW